MLLASVVLIVVAAGAALAFLHPEILLLVFGGILGAIVLDAAGSPLRRIGAPRGVAVVVAALLLLGAAALGASLVGPRLVAQAGTLIERLPSLLDAAVRTLSDTALGRSAIDAAEAADPGATSGWGRLAPLVLGSLAGVFSTALSAAAGLVALFALAVFLAIRPALYVDGALHLVPQPRRARLREVLDAIARALRWWMVGRLIAMASVAGMTAVGLGLLGFELALALGLVAGITTFVPYVGPLLGAVPALLVSLGADGSLGGLAQVALLYTGIQLVDDYVITPVVQGRAISLPPALLVVAQALLGVLLGGLGLVLATPLLVVFVVAVQALYVQDVLGEDVRLLGEAAPARGRPRFRFPGARRARHGAAPR
jgi:predicted PurR-regulated permease PerM